MPVKAIVCNVGFAPSEELHLNLAMVPLEVGLDVLFLKLDTQDLHSECFVKHLVRMKMRLHATEMQISMTCASHPHAVALSRVMRIAL